MAGGEALGANYRLLEQIGRGAAGVVWLATDSRSGASVAAKVLRPEHVAEAELVERFVRERSLLTSLRDPHIVSVTDLVVEGDTLAIIMEYVGGGSVRDLLADRPTLPPQQAVDLVVGVLRGLATAHQQRVLHRDMKPDNVLLGRDWEGGSDGVKVTDFGIAEILVDQPHTSTGLIGTPEYMPPELITSGESGTAGDVYAVGIMLYELLAGRTPFAGSGTDFTVAYRHVTADVPSIEVPPALGQLLDRMLDKNPRLRPSAAQAAAALSRLGSDLAGLPAATPLQAPAAFAAQQRPATALRGLTIETEDDPPSSTRRNLGPMPELGSNPGGTVHRPIRRNPTEVEDAGSATDAQTEPAWWRQPKVLIIAGSTLVVLIVAAVLVFTGLPSPAEPAPPASVAASASQQDGPLPTGLTVSRRAETEPDTGTTHLTITYSAQNAPLQGPFLEVIPGGSPNAECPTMTWSDGDQEENVPSVTGMSVDCGWSVDGVTIEPQSSVEVNVEVNLAFADESALQEWLDGAADATTTAISDSEITSTSYPVQRMQSIEVNTPTRLVSESTVEVTLLPVWPSGADTVNPLMRSPVSGEPSTMLTAIAGGFDGVRFSDGCSGALSVSSDGLTVTALQQATDCQLDARVGNFTDLQSSSLSILTREGS